MKHFCVNQLEVTVTKLSDGSTNINPKNYSGFYSTETKEEAIGLFVSDTHKVPPNTTIMELRCFEVYPKRQSGFWRGYFIGLGIWAAFIALHFIFKN